MKITLLLLCLVAVTFVGCGLLFGDTGLIHRTPEELAQAALDRAEGEVGGAPAFEALPASEQTQRVKAAGLAIVKEELEAAQAQKSAIGRVLDLGLPGLGLVYSTFLALRAAVRPGVVAANAKTLVTFGPASATWRDTGLAGLSLLGLPSKPVEAKPTG